MLVVGRLRGVRLENKNDNTWILDNISLKINGVTRAMMNKDVVIRERKTLTAWTTYIGTIFFPITKKLVQTHYFIMLPMREFAAVTPHSTAT